MDHPLSKFLWPPVLFRIKHSCIYIQISKHANPVNCIRSCCLSAYVSRAAHLTLDNQSGGTCLETNSPSFSNCKLLVAPHLGVGFCDILPSLSGCQLVLILFRSFFFCLFFSRQGFSVALGLFLNYYFHSIYFNHVSHPPTPQLPAYGNLCLLYLSTKPP